MLDRACCHHEEIGTVMGASHLASLEQGELKDAASMVFQHVIDAAVGQRQTDRSKYYCRQIMKTAPGPSRIDAPHMMQH